MASQTLNLNYFTEVGDFVKVGGGAWPKTFFSDNSRVECSLHGGSGRAGGPCSARGGVWGKERRGAEPRPPPSQMLEAPLEKKAGINYGPPGNKQLVYFVGACVCGGRGCSPVQQGRGPLSMHCWAGCRGLHMPSPEP